MSVTRPGLTAPASGTHKRVPGSSQTGAIFGRQASLFLFRPREPVVPGDDPRVALAPRDSPSFYHPPKRKPGRRRGAPGERVRREGREGPTRVRGVGRRGWSRDETQRGEMTKRTSVEVSEIFLPKSPPRPVSSTNLRTGLPSSPLITPTPPQRFQGPLKALTGEDGV